MVDDYVFRRVSPGVSDMFELRRADLSLDDEEQAVVDAADSFLAKNCSSDVVRAASVTGFDATLYRGFADLGMLGMAVPEPLGDGGTFVQIALVAEVVGKWLAPISFADSVSAARLVARADSDEARAAIAEFVAGEATIALAQHDPTTRPGQWVPSLAPASWLVEYTDEALWLSRLDGPIPVVPHFGGTAAGRLADARVLDRTQLAAGSDAVEAFETALREWRILTASALAGLAGAGVALGVDFANTRQTRGVAIGSLQAVSHALVDASISRDLARGLALKAAWFHEHEPAELGVMDMASLVRAAQSAVHATGAALHVHGGAGVFHESDITLYFERAKGWGSIAGDPSDLLSSIGTSLVSEGAH